MRVVIMCKAPVPGRVKTRLFPVYSPAQAAQMHRLMAEAVIGKITRLFDDVWIAADDPAHLFFEGFAAAVVAQGAGDLGERMTRLMRQAFEDDIDGLMFVGTDSPHMPASRLLEAAAMLGDSDIVLGPVEDGGYELIAMRRAYPQMFTGIHWGTAAVLEETLARIRASDLSCRVLPAGFDIDTPEAWQRAVEAGLKLTE